jgi:hypothetical protein
LDDAAIAHLDLIDPLRPQGKRGLKLLFRLWLCFTLRRCLMLLRRSLTLWSCLPLLWSGLALLLRSRLTLLLLLWSRLALLLLLLWSSLTLLLLSGTLLLPSYGLALWNFLTLLLRSRLALLRRRNCLPLLVLNNLALLLLLDCLVLLLLLQLLGSCLSLLLLSGLLIVDLHGCWHLHIAIRGDRPVDRQVGRTSMIHVGKLRAVVAGSAFVLYLRTHGRGVLFIAGSQLRGPGAHLQSA